MTNTTDIAWIDQLEQLIQQKHMLSHRFYQAWTCGHLTKQVLQEYAQEYYHHVKAFPTYLSLLHSRSDDAALRKCLLQNLIDEEAGEPNHPDLWRSFAMALGVGPEEIASHVPRQETVELINTFRTACSRPAVAVGIAVLYCYESQIPAICHTKIEGLKKWYGLHHPDNYRYFTVHETADIEHSRVEKELLTRLVQPHEEKEVLGYAEKALDALWKFLSSFTITV